MRRLFSNPILALLTGLCLRLFFVLQFPAGSGDTGIYEQFAANWLKHGIYGVDVAGHLRPADLRMPGYPAFLAAIYALTGRTGESARFFVMLAQIVVDLLSCVLVAELAAWLAARCENSVDPKRAFLVGLWLAALCPLTANYTAVPLSEVWSMFFTTLAVSILVRVAELASEASPASLPVPPWTEAQGRVLRTQSAVAGLTIGVSTLFRPESPLLLLVALALMTYWLLLRGLWRPWLTACLFLCFTCAMPLVPWVIRNAVTLHELQPLAPENANLPGEFVPRGFMAWEKTWLYRFRDCYLVPWKLDDEEIRIDDIPTSAFDSPEEKERVAALLEQYNEDLSLTPEQDAAFAALARERTARHPFRTFMGIPVRRAVRIWFTPRIELLPVSGHVFPLAYMREEDPVDQRVTIIFFFLNVLYALLVLAGAWVLWRSKSARAPLLLVFVYALVRTAFLTTVETPEPRYVLVCFPALLAVSACAFRGKR